MDLTLPLPTLELGPAWASELNAALFLVDSHNHSPGQGAPIIASSLNINSDLPFNNNNLGSVRSVRFQNQGSPLSLAADVTSVYASGGDLYYNNAIGQQVKITSGASLNAGAIGGIGGDYVTSGALELYTSGILTYSFTTDGTNFAKMRNADISIYRVGTSDFSVSLIASPALAVSYNLTLPTGLPAQQTALSVSATGQILAGIPGGTAADVSPGYGLIPTGASVEFWGTAAPSGYLMCDGTSYLRTTYPALFAVIGTSCGAADGTHFNVPDKRGYFPRGVSGTSGNDPDASSRTAMNPGGNTGNNVGSIQSDAYPSHTHAENGVTGGGGIVGLQVVTGGTVAGTDLQTGSSGSSTETRPKNAYCNYIIKT